ncbi:hypothetical protein [Janthinobacterium sp. P210006]|uniref:hypothetical protein n=1 Tax=Janthinobacterium sp. P210006 TaxID=3112939 RepID=UPI002E26D9D1|nr:hypothetical protein [Janthinobacterium sp. P210006]
MQHQQKLFQSTLQEKWDLPDLSDGARALHDALLDYEGDGVYAELLTPWYPDWLVMLSRNCEYAAEVADFEQPFEDEFRYVASLWAQADSLAAFERAYSRQTSNTHDIE